MSSAPKFSGAEAPAKQARQQTREEALDDVTDFVNAKFPASATPTVCSAFGKDPDEQATSSALMAATGHSSIPLSEELGEQGAIWMLQNVVAENKRKYDDNCLHIFSGANVFNLVYISPTPPVHGQPPDFVLIIEAKGGNSNLGSRWNETKTARVKQGTITYAKTEANVMENSSNPEAAEAAGRVNDAIAQADGRVLYYGVRTPYNKDKAVVYKPEVIFAKKF